ncbi:HAD family hydrolase [Paenibacillus oenotherae]|uniref:HAD family hydrolase n=1 Tax=Paenibacillus oenotherae TaxID=1435645 RepID=A0ABS7D5A4_9BACL|nr:HAD family hydrolase [Paenibacillus oenotherae]MBW7474732.1 HAD family hydrolase [Paenibacillus oenotherae]
MRLKAIFLDFYGTLVHEDDEIIPIICEQIKLGSADQQCDSRAIGSHWWKVFSGMFQNSFGESFKTQRELGIASLAETIAHFNSNCIADELIKPQFAHWKQPRIYEDTLPFIEQFNVLPLYILSNIDTPDLIEAAACHGIAVTDIITSEDVRSYKPRPELFLEALRRYGLLPHEVVHIGDSITSDVAGAGSVGIATIWLNRLNKPKPEGITPDYICSNLNEARQVLFEQFR